MRSITRLFSAFGALATAIEGLAALVDVTSGKLRQSLALDAVEPTLALPAPENASPEEGTEPEASPSASPSASPRRKAKAS